MFGALWRWLWWGSGGSPPPFHPRTLRGLWAKPTRTARWCPPGRPGAWSVPLRTCRWGYPVSVLDQFLPPVAQGEDVAFLLTGNADPANWSLRFTLVPASGSSVVVSTASSPGITVTGPVNGKWTLSVPLSHAITAALAAGEARWQLDRTDGGSEWLLAAGTVPVQAPLVALP